MSANDKIKKLKISSFLFMINAIGGTIALMYFMTRNSFYGTVISTVSIFYGAISLWEIIGMLIKERNEKENEDALSLVW